MDPTRRNNLLYFRELEMGTISCVLGEDGAVEKLFAGEKVSLRRLVPASADPKAARKLRAIARKAQSNMDEKGLQTLFLAYGMATWPVKEGSSTSRFSHQTANGQPRIARGAELSDLNGNKAIAQSKPAFGKVQVIREDGLEESWNVDKVTVTRANESRSVADPDRPPLAPVVLLPITCSAKGGDFDSATLESAGPPQFNMVLTHALQDAFDGLTIDEEALLEAGRVGDEGLNPSLVLDRLRSIASDCQGFEVESRSVLGNFSFQKLAMVKDLKEQANGLAAHDMIAALAGDQDARTSLGGRNVNLDPSGLDRILAENEFMVLDADSSQQLVVHSVSSDLDGVIQGPPGCGKSQTIANIIATLIAQGKRVLFVAEKRAALEAVYKRLEATKLDHLALDLHGAAVSQKAVMGKVSSTLQKIRHTNDPDGREVHDRFEDRRRRVVEHVQTMHTGFGPSGLTPYQLQVGLFQTSRIACAKTRWRGKELEKLNGEAIAKVRDFLIEAQALAPLVVRSDPSPWTNANLVDGPDAQEALDAAQRLSTHHLPDFTALLQQLAQDTGFRQVTTLGEAEQQMSLVAETNEFLTAWDPAILDATEPRSDLAPATRGRAAVLWAGLTSRSFRKARRLIASLSRTNEHAPTALLYAAEKAVSLLEQWSAFGGASCKPRVCTIYAGARQSFDAVASDLAVLTARVPELARLNLTQLTDVASSLAADEQNAHRIPIVRSIEARIDERGAIAILNEIRATKQPPARWNALFEHAYFASCYDAVRVARPALAGFSGESHTRFAQDFQALDKERLAVAAARVSREHAEMAVVAMDAHPAQTLVVRNEAAKRSRHIPLRKLVAQAADVLTAVCPCWMSSPLNVSQLLPADKQLFDVVIFDEASQVLPEDAACSILRGRRLVVAGDQHQLPPTTFFADGGDEEEEDSPIAGFESLLNQLSSFVDHWPLEWHYRSRDERLISFSNRHIYQNSLTTFPGIGGCTAISHIFVQTVPQDGDEMSNAAEVDKVVELVMAHAERQVCKAESEWESLGVIAMGIKHADRIQAACDRALEGRKELDRYFDSKRSEPFFVKNIERVQGDERDHIILTLGYTKSRSGRFNHGLLGPVNGPGGYRRLNVAVTRARQSMTLVSAITFRDVRVIDPAPTVGHKDFGVHLFRQYLEFAESGGDVLGDTGGTGEPMNAFESDIYDALTLHGIPLIAQYGSSGYRLDFAAMHPDRDGEFVLAIECDGATYHSSPTARDRDRLREQQLRSIGWDFHRVWSTDWFLHREKQIELVVSAWEAAVRRSDERLRQRSDPSAALGGLFAPVTNPNPIQATSISSGGLNGRTGSCPTVADFSDLVSMVRWIESDGHLRTHDEIIGEVLPRIGYRKRGPRIVETIGAAIDKSRQL